LFLDLLLTRAVTAPHGLDKADMLFEDVLHLIQALRRVGMLLAVAERLFKQGLLDILQQRRDGRSEVLELHDRLFAVIAAPERALALLDIARTDLKTQRHALHLVLGELPARAVLGQVDLRTDARRLDSLKQLGRLFGYAGLVACH